MLVIQHKRFKNIIIYRECVNKIFVNTFALIYSYDYAHSAPTSSLSFYLYTMVHKGIINFIPAQEEN